MTEPQHPEQPAPKRQTPEKTEAFQKDTDSYGVRRVTPADQTAPYVDSSADPEATDLQGTREWSSSDEDRRSVVSEADRTRPKSVPGYEILGELGRGGLGVVYRARQEGLKRLVALKMILAGSHAGPEELARFQIEA